MSREEQKITHLHYHYHYSHPLPDQLCRHPPKMTKSQVFPQRQPEMRQDDSDGNCGQHAQEVPFVRERERSFRKLKVSNCWSTQNSSGYAEKQQKQTQAPSITSFALEEDHFSLYENDHSSPSRHFQHLSSPFQGETFSVAAKGIIAGYQSELAWYKKEVARLRLVEEECIYLRSNYLKHYQNCQTGQ